MDRHLGECAPCFGEVRLLKQVDTSLRNEKTLDVPAGFVDRVMAKTHPAEVRSHFGREYLRIAAAAVVVIGIGFAAALYAPLEKAKPLTDTSRSLIDAAKAQVQNLIR
jgi:hypothetical protein